MYKLPIYLWYQTHFSLSPQWQNIWFYVHLSETPFCVLSHFSSVVLLYYSYTVFCALFHCFGSNFVWLTSQFIWQSDASAGYIMLMQGLLFPPVPPPFASISFLLSSPTQSFLSLLIKPCQSLIKYRKKILWIHISMCIRTRRFHVSSLFFQAISVCHSTVPVQHCRKRLLFGFMLL